MGGDDVSDHDHGGFRTEYNLLTAQSIAAEIGILTDDVVIEGKDFHKMTPEQQRDILTTIQVMAQCSPQDKLTMVCCRKEMGEVLSP